MEIGELEIAQKIKKVVEKTIEEGIIVTKDLGGTATTMEFAEAVVKEL